MAAFFSLGAGDKSSPPVRKRSDGRLKEPSSCADIRAWALPDEDRRLHMLNLIRQSSGQGGTLGRYIPVETIVDLLVSSKNTDLVRLQRQVDELQALLDVYKKLDLSDDQKRKLEQMKSQIQTVFSRRDFDVYSEGSTTAISSKFATPMSSPRDMTPTASAMASPRYARSVAFSDNIETKEIEMYVHSYSTPTQNNYDNLDAETLRNILADRDKEIENAKTIAVSALQKLEEMKTVMDSSKNEYQQQLRHSQIKIKALKQEKAQQAQAFTRRAPRLADQLSNEITHLQATGDLDVEQKITCLEKQIDVLKCYCTHMSAMEHEGEQLKKENTFFRNQLKKQSEMEEEIESQVHDLEQKVSSSMQEISELKKRSEKLDGVILEKLTLQERLHRLSGVEIQLNLVQKKAEEADALEKENKRLKDELNKYRQQYEYLSKDFDSLSMAQDNSKIHLQNANNETNELKRQLGEMRAKECERKCELNRAKEELAKVTETLKKTKELKDKFCKEKQSLTNEKEELEKKLCNAVNQVHNLNDQVNEFKRKALDLQCHSQDQEDEINGLVSQIEHLSNLADAQQNKIRTCICRMREEIAQKDALIASSAERLCEMESYQLTVMEIQSQLKKTIDSMEENDCCMNYDDDDTDISYECPNTHKRCECDKDHIGDVLVESKKVVEYLLDKVQEMCCCCPNSRCLCGTMQGNTGNDQQLVSLMQENQNLRDHIKSISEDLTQHIEEETQRCCQLEFELQIEIANRVSLENDNKMLKSQLSDQRCQSLKQNEHIVMTMTQEITKEKQFLNQENQLLRNDILRLETDVMTMCKDLELLQNTNRNFESKMCGMKFAENTEQLFFEAGDTKTEEKDTVNVIDILESLHTKHSEMNLYPKSRKLKHICEKLKIQTKLIQNEIDFLEKLTPDNESDVTRLQIINKESQKQINNLENEINFLMQQSEIPPSDADMEKLKRFILKLQTDVLSYRDEIEVLKTRIIGETHQKNYKYLEEKILQKCDEVMEKNSECNSDYKSRVNNLEVIVDTVKSAVKYLENTVSDIKKEKSESEVFVSKNDSSTQVDENLPCSMLCTEKTSKLLLEISNLQNVNREQIHVLETLKKHIPDICVIIQELQVNVAEIELDNSELLKIVQNLDEELSTRRIHEEVTLLKRKLETDNMKLIIKKLEKLIADTFQRKEDERDEQNKQLSEMSLKIHKLQTENLNLLDTIEKLEKKSNSLTTDLQKVVVECTLENVSLKKQNVLLTCRISNLENSLTTLKNVLEETHIDATNTTKSVKEKISSLTKRNFELYEENNKIQKQNMKQKNDLHLLHYTIKELQNENDIIKNEMRKSDTERKESNLEFINQINYLKQQIYKLENDESDLTQENQTLLNEVSNYKTELQNIKLNNSKIIEGLENENNELKLYKTNEPLLKQQIEDLKLQKQVLNEQKNFFETEFKKYETIKIKNQQIKKVNKQLEDEISLIKNENIKMQQEIEELQLNEKYILKDNQNLKMLLTDNQKLSLELQKQLEMLKQNASESVDSYDKLIAENIDLKKQITFNVENFVSKLKELEDHITLLEEENEKLKKEAETMKQVIQDLEEIGNKTDLEKENSCLRRELDSVKQQLCSTSLHLKQSKESIEQLQNLQTRSSELSISYKQLEGEYEKLMLEKKALLKKVEKLENEIKGLHTEIGELQNQLKTRSSEESTLRNVQNKATKIKANSRDLNKLVANLELEIDRLKNEKEQLKKELEEKFSKSLSSLKQQYDRNAEHLKASHMQAVKRLQEEHNHEMYDLNKDHEVEIGNLQEMINQTFRELETYKSSYYKLQDELQLYKKSSQVKTNVDMETGGTTESKKTVGDKSTLTDINFDVFLQQIHESKTSELYQTEISDAQKSEGALSFSPRTSNDHQELSPRIDQVNSFVDTQEKQGISEDKISLLRHIAAMEESLTRKQNAAQQKLYVLYEEMSIEKERLAAAKRALVDERRTYNNLMERLQAKTRHVADIEVERNLLRQRTLHNEQRIRDLISELENNRSAVKNLEQQLRLERSAVKHLQNLQDIEKSQRKF